MKKVIIEAKNISKSYKIKKEIKTLVLNDVSISINENEITALVGPSGVGKSTLLYLLGTLDNPNSGEIFFNEGDTTFNYSKLNSTELAGLRNRSIGFVFQFHHLLPEFTALENVMIPALIAGTKNSTAKEQALDLISKVGMEHRQKHKPQELSGGEQQRIAIARALINSPKIVFADEPTGNLDAANAQAFIDLIFQVRKLTGTTFVIATHSTEVASIADRVVQMKNGRIEP